MIYTARQIAENYLEENQPFYFQNKTIKLDVPSKEVNELIILEDNNPLTTLNI